MRLQKSGGEHFVSGAQHQANGPSKKSRNIIGFSGGDAETVGEVASDHDGRSSCVSIRDTFLRVTLGANRDKRVSRFQVALAEPENWSKLAGIQNCC